MIRINLVREERRTEKSGFSLNVNSSDMVQGIVFGGLFLVTIGVCIFLFFNVTGKIADKLEDIRQAQLEINSLQDVKEIKEQLEREKLMLRDRYEILTKLLNDERRSPIEEIALMYALQQMNNEIVLTGVEHTSSPDGDSLEISGEGTKEQVNAYCGSLNDLAFVKELRFRNQKDEKFSVNVTFHPIFNFDLSQLPEDKLPLVDEVSGEAEGQETIEGNAQENAEAGGDQ